MIDNEEPRLAHSERPSRDVPRTSSLRIAIILPCYNEHNAVAGTISDFAASLPGATVYVYDNCSTDLTAELARAAGAVVRRERMQGKGHVVRRMFADVEADVYVMADGDATYDASLAPDMVRLLVEENLDMVVGTRVTAEHTAYRRGHRFGNALLTGMLASLFGQTFTDILSGYRVLSRRFVKSFPALSVGFEIETEMSVHALELRLPVGEVKTAYRARPEGSASKLSTYRDGFRILVTIANLLRSEKPVWFFGFIGGALALLSIVLAIPLASAYAQTGLVPRLPTAVLSTGLMIVAVLSFACGLILDTVVRGRREVRRLAYLALPALPE